MSDVPTRSATLGLRFDLAPETAIRFFRAKGLATSFDARALTAEEHARAFTVAKMMDLDLLADVKAAVDQALAEGLSVAEFRARLVPLLQQRGWWGRQVVRDPVTGAAVEAQLGSASRLETIFRTNLQSAYAVGAWEQIEQNRETAPYLMWDAIDDDRTDDACLALDGVVLPVDHAFWKTHGVPLHFGCRCSLIQLSEHELAALGKTGPDRLPRLPREEVTNTRTGETRRLLQGQDVAFDGNPGREGVRALAEALGQKTAAADPALSREMVAALQGLRSNEDRELAAIAVLALAAYEEARRARARRGLPPGKAA